MSSNRNTIELPFDIPPLIGSTVLAAISFFLSLLILRMLAHFLLLIVGLFFRNQDQHPVEKWLTQVLGYLTIVGAVFLPYRMAGLIATLIAGGILFSLYFFWFRHSEEPDES